MDVDGSGDECSPLDRGSPCKLAADPKPPPTPLGCRGGLTPMSIAVDHSPKAALEVPLVALAVGEARAGGLSPTYAAAVCTPVHLRLVEAKHLDAREEHTMMKSKSAFW